MRWTRSRATLARVLVVVLIFPSCKQRNQRKMQDVLYESFRFYAHAHPHLTVLTSCIHARRWP